MNYAESSYFDGFHFAHIAARDEAARLERKRAEMRLVARSWGRARLRDSRKAA